MSHLQRATISHQLTACLTEPLFPLALFRASYLDAHLARTGTPLGPLHGLPISIKDSFHITGYDSSIGIASLCHKPGTKNATIVDILLAAGAVIHCKTNVPQTLMALDSVNNIFGRTLNPENRRDWTAGGSSGGEGVLVKMRGSVMGVGTDVGGSVRIPAMCNGIYGFKPSLGRIPAEGQTGAQLEAAGKVGMESVVGPIANDLADIDLFMEVVEAAEAWKVDAAVIPGKWWKVVPRKNKKDLLIGIVCTDGIATPLPPVRRMLSDTVRLLNTSGISTISLPTAPPLLRRCLPISNKLFTAEGSTHTLSLLSHTTEPLIPWLQPRLKHNPASTINNLRDLQARKIRLQTDFLISLWKTKTQDGRERDIDAFICPVAPHPVPGLDEWNTVNYTSAFVLLDYPAAVVPVGSVTAADLDEEVEGGEVLGGWDRVNRRLWDGEGMGEKKRMGEKKGMGEGMGDRVNKSLWGGEGKGMGMDRKRYLGSPLCVQVVGPRLQEKRVWDVSRVLEEAVKGMEKVNSML